ncbi:winged helix-turn-helix transcriptional regulator [Pukyongiella litopenaei]|uniref:Helix-turn-helix transcriptional regulator n=1 Tax=Pukyongiella litopenaei TaxID=2605946 RepID=A0A2S0MP49_9RHOB|nr:helix-turn-helix domain-containing protein [Pukyongiella litopenaei]AVO37531.1 helix-turn-helix transcriptional regulator [Pukyongiella litopenaei]
MKSYGQFCPVAKAAEVFCERWNALIVRDLAHGPRRFTDLQRGVPLMSPSLLSSRLKWLIEEGVIERHNMGEKRPGYALTKAGGEFVPVVEGLGIWGQRWTRRELKEHEIDLGLLVWGLESSANPDAFGARRCLIRLELSDQADAKRFWWFLNQKEKCELCVDDPGGDVNLYVACTLPDAIHIIRGDVTMANAIDTHRLEVLGDGWARLAFADWLNLGPLAKVPSRRNDA